MESPPSYVESWSWQSIPCRGLLQAQGSTESRLGKRLVADELEQIPIDAKTQNAGARTRTAKIKHHINQSSVHVSSTLYVYEAAKLGHLCKVWCLRLLAPGPGLSGTVASRASWPYPQ